MSAQTVTVRLRHFAVLREALGRDTETLSLPEGSTIAAVRAQLASRSSQVAEILAHCLVARNRAYATDDTLIADGDEIVFLPPMAGGVEDLPASISDRVAALAEDHIHGASEIFRAAGQIVRDLIPTDRDNFPVAIDQIWQICRLIAHVHPSMATLAHLAACIADALAESDPDTAVCNISAILESLMEDHTFVLAEYLRAHLPPESRILGISRSGTLLQVLPLLADRLAAVLWLESRPGSEGVATIAALVGELRSSGWQGGVTILPDAAMYDGARQATHVVVGADALLAEGCAINKIGSLPLALIAQQLGIPCLVVTESSKIAPASWQWRNEAGIPAWMNDLAQPGIRTTSPLFEQIPFALLTVITERGVMSPEAIQADAARLDTGYRRLC